MYRSVHADISCTYLRFMYFATGWVNPIKTVAGREEST